MLREKWFSEAEKREKMVKNITTKNEAIAEFRRLGRYEILPGQPYVIEGEGLAFLGGLPLKLFRNKEQGLFVKQVAKTTSVWAFPG